MMFADAHRLATASFEKRLEETCAHLEQRLAAEIGALRAETTRQLSDLRVDIVKWSFLFWLGQFAALTAVLSFVLGGR